MVLRFPPGQIVAIAMAVLGLALIVATFTGAGPTPLVFGLVLVVAALITSGLQALNSHGGVVPTWRNRDSGEDA